MKKINRFILATATLAATGYGLAAGVFRSTEPSFDKPGFVTAVANERLWVFREGSGEWTAFQESSKGPAVHTVRPKAGPNGMTVLSPDTETLTEYLTTKPGFVTAMTGGRLWIFRDGSDELAAFRKSGKGPAVHTVRPKAGPMGLTIMSPETEILDDYMKAK